MRTVSRLAALAAVLGWAAFSPAQITFKYTTFSYPNATSTTANGINNGNVIVGSWLDSKNAWHGYRYANSKFTSIDHPGANNTFVNGINDDGDLVGYYTTTTDANVHGFMLHNGTFTVVNFPGQSGSVPMGINKYGEIVGYFANAHGFIYSGGKYRQFDAPDNSVPDTMLNGVSNLGAIVGQVFSYDNWRAFLLVGSDLDFSAARGARDVQAYGVNGHGDVVGCMDGGNGYLALNPESGESESSEKSLWKTQPISVAENRGTCPMSINYARAIVGNATGGTNPGDTVGFLAVPQ